MNLSTNFTLEEATRSQVALRRGIDNTPNAEIQENMIEAANHLEDVRSLLGVAILVSSWHRSPKLNTIIGGSATSAHCEGWAIDFTAPDFGTPKSVCQAIVSAGILFDQLIFEGTWVHISFSPRMRREVLTARFEDGKVSYLRGIV